MAELAADNITVTIVCGALGISPVTNILIRDHLCNASNINKWSFYRSRPISLDGSKNVVLSSAPTSDRKLGDFRRYNHTALTPKAANDFTQNWGPGGATFTITLVTFIERLNVKELLPSSTPYLTTKYYPSATDRTNKTNVIRTNTVLLTLSAESPPAGHTNNQTSAPSSSSQIVIDSGVPTSAVSSPDDILYCDTYISDISGNELVRFDDSFTDVSTHELTNPFVDAFAPNLGSVPAGYTSVFPVVTDSSSNHSGVDFAQSNGNSTYGTFYWYLVGIKAGSFYRLGSVAAVATLRIRNPEGGSLENETQIFNSTLNAAGGSSNQSASGTLSSSYLWAFDDVGDVEVTVSSWTGFTEFLLPGAP